VRSYLSPPSFWDVTPRHSVIDTRRFEKAYEVSSSREYSPLIPIRTFDASITQSPNSPTRTKTSTASPWKPKFAHLPTIMHPYSVLPFIQFVAICSIFPDRALSLSLSLIFPSYSPFSYLILTIHSSPFIPVFFPFINSSVPSLCIHKSKSTGIYRHKLLT
jgi:hypothetical protein